MKKQYTWLRCFYKYRCGVKKDNIWNKYKRFLQKRKVKECCLRWFRYIHRRTRKTSIQIILVLQALMKENGTIKTQNKVVRRDNVKLWQYKQHRFGPTGKVEFKKPTLNQWDKTSLMMVIINHSYVSINQKNIAQLYFEKNSYNFSHLLFRNKIIVSMKKSF